jgi:hypothetical protein
LNNLSLFLDLKLNYIFQTITKSTSSTVARCTLIADKEPVAPVAPDDALVDQDSSSTSSSGSSSSSISDEDQVDTVPEFPQEIGSSCFSHVEKFLPVKHRQTHRLHLLVNAEHTRLICGRALSQTYERLDRFPSHPLPTCVQCFASKLVGSFDEC